MKNTQPMHPQLLELLKANRMTVESSYDRFIRLWGDMNIIASKKFFFEVVYNELVGFSKIKINRSLKSDYQFGRYLMEACDKAENACKSPFYKEARQHKINSISRDMAAKLDLI
jgi:hypothetical protein